MATGAAERIEQLIGSRLAHALHLLEAAQMRPTVRAALAEMASACTERAA
jgi:geranylgeranyl diphosphate synthase type I